MQERLNYARPLEMTDVAMPIRENARSAEAIHRKLRAIAAVLLDPACAQAQLANIGELAHHGKSPILQRIVGDASIRSPDWALCSQKSNNNAGALSEFLKSRWAVFFWKLRSIEDPFGATCGQLLFAALMVRCRPPSI
jgi:hypothetical protein